MIYNFANTHNCIIEVVDRNFKSSNVFSMWPLSNYNNSITIEELVEDIKKCNNEDYRDRGLQYDLIINDR